MTTRLAAAILFLSAPILPAQDLAGRPQQWGTASESILTLQAYAFEPSGGGGTNTLGNSFFSRYCNSVCAYDASVTLPAGALLQSIELEACDVSPTATITATLVRVAVLEQAVTALGSVNTGAASQPGCDFFTAPLNHTVENLNGSYVIHVAFTGTTIDTRFQAIRIYYRLQVSPAPATATFNDVPTTHFAFRFVEALAASGITGGCGAGTYCPDAAVTRAQMAIFLATALGLHFPN